MHVLAQMKWPGKGALQLCQRRAAMFDTGVGTMRRCSVNSPGLDETMRAMRSRTAESGALLHVLITHPYSHCPGESMKLSKSPVRSLLAVALAVAAAPALAQNNAY